MGKSKSRKQSKKNGIVDNTRKPRKMRGETSIHAAFQYAGPGGIGMVSWTKKKKIDPLRKKFCTLLEIRGEKHDWRAMKKK